MIKAKKQMRIPMFWMAYIIVIFQALWNPVLINISTLQIYFVSALLLILLVIKTLFGKVTTDTLHKFDSFPFWSYFCYCLIFIFSALTHELNQFALGNFARISYLFLTLSFLQSFNRGLESLVNLYFLLNCFMGLILLIKFITNGIDISNRISPVGQGSANCFGATIAIISLLRISLQESFSRFENFFVYFFGLPITLLIILGTYSRGATLGFIIGLILLGLQKSKISHTPRIIGLGLLLLIYFEIFGFSNSPLLLRFSAKSFLDLSGRNVIFQNALDSFIENPFFGRGVGSKINPFLSGEASTHNVFLQVVGETGLLGLILLLLLLTLVVYRYHPKYSAPAMACLLMVSLTDNHFLAVQFHLALGLTYLTLLRDRKNRDLIFNKRIK